jgi:hypothetical protein
MVHDVIKINADSEAVGGLHHLEQLGLGSVAGGDGAGLVLVAEIERIKLIVANLKSPAVAFRRIWHPKTAVTGLGNFRHPRGQIRPTDIE